MVHSQRLERWLGKEQVEQISQSMTNWYGKPIPIGNTQGVVYATKGGGFCGKLKGGYYGSLADYTIDKFNAAIKRASKKQLTTLNTGFSSLSDLISEITTGGKSQMLIFTKSGTTGVVGRSNSLFNVGSFPSAGGTGGTTGTGRACTSAINGALKQANPSGSDTLHFISSQTQGSVGTQSLLMYDRLWDMTHTMTVDPRSCDAANVPTRYQTAALAPSNFFSGEVTTVLPAATPTITLDYVDQDGNNVTGPALSTIASAAAVNTVPFTSPNWFYPLDPADTGLRSLQNSANAINLSAAMASGVVTWFIGHPLVFIPCPTANVPVLIDGINSAINLQRIYDNACLSFLELNKGATTATTWWGQILLCAG